MLNSYARALLMFGSFILIDLRVTITMEKYFSLFSVTCIMLQWWMMILNMAKVSNTEVSVSTSKSLGAKAMAFKSV